MPKGKSMQPVDAEPEKGGETKANKTSCLHRKPACNACLRKASAPKNPETDANANGEPGSRPSNRIRAGANKAGPGRRAGAGARKM